MRKIVFGMVIFFAPLLLHGLTKVYVTSGNSTVTILDADTNTVLGNFTPSFGGESASTLSGIGVSPDGKVAYIADISNGIWVIDTIFDTAINHLFSGVSAGFFQVAFSPDGSKVYVSVLEGDVVALSAEDSSIITVIGGGAQKPSGIAFNPSGTKVYISEGSTNLIPYNVYVYNVSDNSLVTTISLPDPVSFLAINSLGIGYAPSSTSNAITVFDTTTDEVTHTLNATGTDLFGLAFTNDGSVGYVACDSDENLQWIVNGVVSNSPISLSNSPFDLAINPRNNNQVYVAINETVAVVVNNEQISAPAFDEYFSLERTSPFFLAYILPNGIPTPPLSLAGEVIYNQFVLQTDIVHRLTWQASASLDVAHYLIKRNGVEIGTVLPSATLFYDDHNQLPYAIDLYEVIAVSSFGYQSDPVSISLP